MANQIVVSAGAKVRNLQDVIIGTSGVLTSLGFDVANGVPRLDVNGKILVSQLPNSVMEYKGTWNAATNTPTLVNGTGNQGDVYLCNVAGTVDFGAGAIAFVVGDQVIYSGSIWQRASGATGTVTSVAVTESGDSLNITGSPITTSGTINIGFNGTNLQYVNGAGNLTTFPILTGYVPYTGATANLDLGTFDLTTDIVNLNQLKAIGSGGLNIYSNSGTHIALMGGGGGAGTTLYGGLIATTASFASSGGSDTFAINHSSGAGIALNITKGGSGEGLYINKTSGSGNAATIIGTLNATTLVKSGGTSAQFLMADGSTSTLTNPVTGTGTTNTLPKFTAASTIGNSNITDTGSLITLNSNSYINGALGIGTTSLTGYNLRVNKNLTGATTSRGISSEGRIQSDVVTAYLFSTNSETAAAAFSTDIVHYFSSHASTGAGSTITSNTAFMTGNLTGSSVFGFRALSSLSGSSTTQGFRGDLAAGTNVWNLFMNGTANNYMAGSLGIGSTSLTNSSLNVSKTITGSTTSIGIVQGGVVQSGVTSNAYGFYNSATTQAAAFTLGTYIHYGADQSTIGSGSAITTQVGYNASATLIGATNNYGFKGSIASGTNRWNIYMDGTANNYMAGSLGIGSTSLTGVNLRIEKAITGGTTSYSIRQQGTVQSDVTVTAIGIQNTLNTAASAFTLSEYTHFVSSQGIIGVGSTVTNQYGFIASSSLTGATNNYGFYGNIASGTNRWNIYMAGTAANYLAGNTFIGATTDDTISRLQVYGTNWAANFNVNAAGGINLTRTNAVGANSTHYSVVFKNSDSTVAAFNTINRTGATTSTGTGYELNIAAVGTGYITNYTNGVERTRVKSTGQMRFVPLASDPSGAEAGDVYYNSTISALKLYDGTVWRTITVI
jgi:hypothetical protein